MTGAADPRGHTPSPREAMPVWRSLPTLAAAAIAGLVLVGTLVALVPARATIPIGRPGGLVPPMLFGVHDVEKNYGHWIRWTTGHARLEWPARFGADPSGVVLTLAGFPGRQPDRVEVRVNGRVSRHAVPEGYEDVRVDLPRGTRAPLTVEVVSLTTTGFPDTRPLGVRLEAVHVEQRPLFDRLRAVRGAAGVWLLGAAAWLWGAWAVGTAAAVGGTRPRWHGALLAWGTTALACVVIAPVGLRQDTWLTLLPVLLGVATTVLLARGATPSWASGVAGLVVGLQAIVLVTWCAAAFVDVPRWDIWDVVTMLQDHEARGLSLADLWAPHNEHRPVVARAVALANIALSDWNHWNELWVMLVVTAAHVLVLVWAVRACAPTSGVATVLAVVGIATFVGSPTQWENFLQGWQIALIAGAASISTAFVLLTARGRPTWTRVSAAAVSVFVGTAGFGSCLLGWPLGGLALLVRRERRWLAHVLAWTTVGVAVMAAYVHGLTPNPGHPPPAPVFRSLTAALEVLIGTMLALGLPVWYTPTIFVVAPRAAAIWILPAIGACAAMLALTLIVVHWRRRSRADATWLLPSLLVVFALGACAVTAVGRVTFGLHAMTASRYISFTALFWVGLVLLLTVATPFRSRVARVAGFALAAIIVTAGVRAWGDSLPYFELHHVQGVRGREALLRTDWPKTHDIFPVAPTLDELRQVLQRRKLSVYR